MTDDRKCSKCGTTEPPMTSYHHKTYCQEHKAEAIKNYDTKYAQLEWLKSYGFPIITIVLVVIFGIITIYLTSSGK